VFQSALRSWGALGSRNALRISLDLTFSSRPSVSVPEYQQSCFFGKTGQGDICSPAIIDTSFSTDLNGIPTGGWVGISMHDELLGLVKSIELLVDRAVL
jgi:hypothetical protein